MLLAIKKRSKIKVSRVIEIASEIHAIELEIEEQVIILVSVYMRDKKRGNLEKIEKIIEDNKDKVIMLGGDFNARTENEGGKVNEETNKDFRKSKDKIVNKEGEEVLEWMSEQGVYIMNGNVTGDEKGKHTFVGAVGISVTDYVIVNREAEESITEIKVGKGINSDHQPVIVQIRNEREEEAEEEEKWTIRWNEKNINKGLREMLTFHEKRTLFY